MAMDRSTIRLRASCNACNESKVRCSQLKPTCARCERNGTECIYGLSRRTHKDAPPISMPSSQRSARSSRTSINSDTNNNSNWRTLSFQKSATTTPSTGSGSPDAVYEANLVGDYIPPGVVQQAPIYTWQASAAADSIHGSGHMLDFNSLITSNSGPLTDIDYYNTQILETLFDSNPSSDSGVASDMVTFWAQHGGCTCHAGVTEMLVMMRSGNDDRGLSLDAQLAKLKQCIVSSETSMGCAHVREDTEPTHIMAVSTLISYVIDDFKILASESSLHRQSAATAAALRNCEKGNDCMTGLVATSSNISQGGISEPRLSWGVLELEDDDEKDLRHRLYLLSFRKLESLLSQLTLYLRSLHDTRANLSDPSRQMAFVTACDYTLLWLKKKAEDVKKLFSVACERQDDGSR